MAYYYEQRRKQAKELLAYYFKLIGEKVGMKWNSDNTAEVEGIVDLLIEAAEAKIKGE